MEQWLLYMVPAAGVLALLFAWMRSTWISTQEAGTPEMTEISGHIRQGAMAFMAKEYRVLALFVAIIAPILGFMYYQQGGAGVVSAAAMGLVAVAFVVGALCSAMAGYFGMRVATTANVRTAHAARTGLTQALHVAFSGGAVMGMSVVGLALIGIGVLMLSLTTMLGIDLTADVRALATTQGVEALRSHELSVASFLAILTGFSLGASSIALFARVGGGIYTKAADVGADLVGKVEAGIPEDDPRNPATIADNVGDNVGDVAGMGADLFESYVGAIIGAMVLALSWAVGTTTIGAGVDMVTVHVGNGPLLLPLMIAAVGIVISIGCTFLVRVTEGGNPAKALNTGTISAAVLTAIATAGLVYWAIPAAGVTVNGVTYSQFGPFYATLAGLISGSLIGLVTEYYTSDHYGPVRGIAKDSEMGYAPNIIAGLSQGMMSTAIPVLLIVIAIGISYFTSGLYGIALAALGMLATIGIQLAVDAFGPIADNAGGIAEMSHLPPEVRERTDKLDSVGNTTAAIGKGFAIGSAALTALALFAAFSQQANLPGIDLLNPLVMSGAFIGAVMPFVFSAMTMKAVGRSANAMIDEVRRQFREIPGLLDGTGKADYARCVEISTDAALKEMILPGVMAIGVAVAAGFWNPLVLGGVLVGVTTSGVAMALFMSNAGGAWDNAKKYIEAGAHGGKGSDAHKAAIAGDTVGDPFKDTSGPSLNILIKLMSVVALVLAPIIALDSVPDVPVSAVVSLEQVVEVAKIDSAQVEEQPVIAQAEHY